MDETRLRRGCGNMPLELARAVFAVAVEKKPSDRFMIRNRIRSDKQRAEM
jgi:hypothetical protein